MLEEGYLESLNREAEGEYLGEVLAEDIQVYSLLWRFLVLDLGN
jgi:hypothetical protein